ncbi:MAG: protein kinase, partial [Clostridia bacterium]|nr:protein kinase [Clostridia bacterium]
FAKEVEAGNFVRSLGKHRKYFNAPKLDKYGNIRMKLASAVLDADEYINRADDEKSGLTIDFFKTLARQVLKGLSAIHGKGYIHGDIKPDNIQIVGGRFKIADLGTCECASKGVPGSTNSYAHPNAKADSSEEQKQKNDVYALGCTLMDILCGKRLGNYMDDFYIESIFKTIPTKFTHESMKNVENIRKLLWFIKKLCNKNLDEIPTAHEALQDHFLQKNT